MFAIRLLLFALQVSPRVTLCARRSFTGGAASLKNLPSRPKPPPDSEIEESYLKGSGPGGQKINKTNSAVQLKHIPTGIVVKSQATRSRSQNRKHAREILAQRLDDLINGEQSRAAVVGGIKKKRADSAAKKSRRKYRKLEEERESEREEGVDGEGGERQRDTVAPAGVVPEASPGEAGSERTRSRGGEEQRPGTGDGSGAGNQGP
ncbi:putative peptide chain release factor-like protein [Escovopsis weberi]|uniref:Putative peptide chain release factor-like protein n=1 Tax=Escovopsis weberi TaxID=150374 RepID=A0A0M8MX58_ESCWE|nr:putative peptide chain release factor-like protein [Escovopsis weberi]